MDVTLEDSEVQNFERHIEKNKPLVKAGEMLQRLEKNADFQALIVQGYFREESIRLVQAISVPTPEMQSEATQKDLYHDMRAIGSLQNYLALIDLNARHATDAIKQSEESLEEIRNEENAEHAEDY